MDKIQAFRGIFDPAEDGISRYPLSTKLFPIIFMNMLQRYHTGLSSTPDSDDLGLNEPDMIIKNKIRWNPFIMGFAWPLGTENELPVQNHILSFIHELKIIQSEAPNPEKQPLASFEADSESASILVNHPDQALSLLQKAVVSKRLSISSMAAGPSLRNYLTGDTPFKEREEFDKAAVNYHSLKNASHFDCPGFLKDLPAAPYASLEAARVFAGIEQQKRKNGRLVIDLDCVANAVATDCGRRKPFPHRDIH